MSCRVLACKAHAPHLIGALIFVLAAGVFLPIRNHEWLNYDDNVYVTESAPVRSGLNRESIVWAFSSFDGANWFPVTRLSWMLDAEIHGLVAGRFLLTNLLLHALTCVLLFASLRRLSGRLWPSAFAAAVFAVHPLHIESVAWVSARKDPLSGLFWMLALLLYAQQLRSPSRTRRAALFGCVALGLMSKPTVVTLPFVLLLLDFWPLERLGAVGERRGALRRAVVEKLPLFALSAVFSAVTFLAQRSGGTVASLDRLPVSARVANALVSYVSYLAKAFWPTRLAIFHPHAEASVSRAAVASAALILLTLTLGAWHTRRRRAYFAVGWLWFLGTLFPVIGLVQVGSQAMADRYMYLPIVGLIIAVAWGSMDALAKVRGRRPILAVAGCAVVTALAITTTVELRYWRDSESLFRHALEVTDDNYVAHSYLGTALRAKGQTAEAIRHYRRSLQIRPNQLTLCNNLAWLLATDRDAAQRDPHAAVELAQRAEQLSVVKDPAVLDTLAAAYASAGRFDDAIRTAEQAADLSRRRGGDALANEIEQRLARYRTRRPYVEDRP